MGSYHGSSIIRVKSWCGLSDCSGLFVSRIVNRILYWRWRKKAKWTGRCCRAIKTNLALRCHTKKCSGMWAGTERIVRSCPNISITVIIIILWFLFQFQDTEASNELQRFWIVTKSKRQQVQAGERWIRVCFRRGGAEDRWIPHQTEKELSEEGSVLWVPGTFSHVAAVL